MSESGGDIDMDALCGRLDREAPRLRASIGALAERWLGPALRQLDANGLRSYPKTFSDPIWGVIELMPWEVLLLDSPLLQRLRGVRQLGLSHLVYPGALHDRLEHTRGVVEAAERMMRALERNAAHHRRFGEDRSTPAISASDRVATRLAALLHDTGHGPFSHASEYVLADLLPDDFPAAAAALRDLYDVPLPAPGEVLSCLIALSPAMRRIFAHPRFTALPPEEPLEEPAGAPAQTTGLLPRILARILGSERCADAPCVAGLISGPIDADKLDYMSRDSHHAGLPLGHDLGRLISKLEVLPEARSGGSGGRMGIALSGVAAYEQMIIARALLYDRIYYHHKVRAAEAMVKRLISVCEEERGQQLMLHELLCDHPDDAVICLLGGIYRIDGFTPGGPRARAIAEALRRREIHFRAFAFSRRFLACADDLPEPERELQISQRWQRVRSALQDDGGRSRIEAQILDTARALAALIPAIQPLADQLDPAAVILDLPLSKPVAKPARPLTRTEDGMIGTPNLFFDPSRWSGAWEEHKQSGFVFTARPLIPLIAAAAAIVFAAEFAVPRSAAALRASKTQGLVPPEWFAAAAAAGICSVATAGLCAALPGEP